MDFTWGQTLDLEFAGCGPTEEVFHRRHHEGSLVPSRVPAPHCVLHEGDGSGG